MLLGTNQSGTHIIIDPVNPKNEVVWHPEGFYTINSKTKQQVRIFFGPAKILGKDVPAPTFEEKTSLTDELNSDNPLFQFVGNHKAVRKINRVIFSALGHPLHICRELFFAFLGPSSAGKTTLARLYAESLKIPFIEISPKSCPTISDLVDQICESIERQGLPIHRNEDGSIDLPPCCVLIDEVHALSNYIVQGLLKATEYKDSMLVTEKGVRVNCQRVSWNVATTDAGRLFDAFRLRFTPIELTYLTKREVATVVEFNNPEFDGEWDVCQMIAHYCPIPRAALAFAREMKLEKEMRPNLSWETIAKTVAHDNNIDEFGMNEKHVFILKLLSEGATSGKRLADKIGVKIEELEKIWIPFLQISTEDRPALIAVSSKGYELTPAGKQSLIARGFNL